MTDFIRHAHTHEVPTTMGQTVERVQSQKTFIVLRCRTKHTNKNSFVPAANTHINLQLCPSVFSHVQHIHRDDKKIPKRDVADHTHTHTPESKPKSLGSCLIVTWLKVVRGWARPGPGGGPRSVYRGSTSSCLKTRGPWGTRGSERWRWYSGRPSRLGAGYGEFALFSGGRKDKQGSDSCRWNLNRGRTGSKGFKGF